MLKKILKRISALIILKVSGVLAAGSLFGLEVWQAAATAAFVGIMEVTEELSRRYVDDGKLTSDEIDDAFRQDER